MLETILVVIFGLLMGVAFTFFGLRVFLVLLPVWGFFAGFWLGAQGISLLSGEAFMGSTTAIYTGLALGIIFGVASYFSFEFGVAAVTAVFGINLITGVMQALGYSTGTAIVVVSAVVAILLVWLLYRYQYDRYLVMAMTALGGASLLVAMALIVTGGIQIEQVTTAGNAVSPILDHSWLWTLVWLALAGLGLAFQLRASRDFDFTMHDLVDGWS